MSYLTTETCGAQFACGRTDSRCVLLGNRLWYDSHQQQLHCNIEAAGGVEPIGAGGGGSNGNSSSSNIIEVSAVAAADDGITRLATKACRYDS